MNNTATDVQHVAQAHLPLSQCAQKAGGPLAGLLLFRIQHYVGIAKVRRHGFRWVANTRVFWCADTGMSLEQYKRVIKILISRGLVVTKIMRFAGQPMTHIRLGETLHSNDVPGHQAHGVPGPHSSGGPALHSSTGDLTGDLHESETKKSHYALRAFGDIQGKEEGQKMDSNVKEVIRGDTKAADIVVPVLAGKKANPTALAAQAHVMGGQLEKLWREQVALASPGYHVTWTAKRTGQMKNLANKVGPTIPLVLAYTIANWADFTWYTKNNHSVKKPPTQPEVWFMLMQTEALLNWYQQETKPKAVPVKLIATAVCKPVVLPVQVAGAMPTEADLAALDALVAKMMSGRVSHAA
ncbi:MAG TPA: hypothetical protein VFC37_13040 [Terracidiphilus sp.]|nr:hypothetical protein [Terracidiphilus sp.]